jgi:hypothetical protein
MNALKDAFGRVEGTLELWIRDVAGALLDHQVLRNLVVDSGRLLMTQGMASTVNRVGVGTNGAQAAPGDVAPLEDQFAKAFSGITYPAPRQVEFAFTIAANEYNGNTIREFGLLAYADDEFTLFARRAWSGIEKTADVQIQGQWTLTF